MNAIKKMLIIPTSALLFAAAMGSAQADSLPIDRIDNVLSHASDYGFTQYEEISIEDRGRAEVEGWLDNEWYADVEFSIDSGETLQEQRERLITGAWGMSEDDIRQALQIAQQEGMVEFEDIDIDKNGIIDIEGHDESGRELEISVRQGSAEVTQIDRD
ncbi:PepSY domain-containing protein [Vreelandella populi]|uniref:PepSY domain-containing protein n=1 Tax=Vreelandella populi TaxID=2498858 RepID=A0A433L9X7_9GAMM|nr:PepSY domain-containing protein [Halomonas populi]RUR41225.1 PepSY domain-containing protein [Halomonas populi]RUR44370.1 PepSY domain-containing protein [Halomonas populi]RUR52030.1 PepSY domain-containing protein [Halomonas populi]